jgi:hypothetical protein
VLIHPGVPSSHAADLCTPTLTLYTLQPPLADGRTAAAANLPGFA